MAIDYQKEGRIATFIINRPEAFNSINAAALKELFEAMIDFRDDPELWVGIVTGAGKAFCAGADIEEMLPLMKANQNSPWKISPSIMRGLELWKPLIAAVNGIALGGGLELVIACDLRIAAENARFGTPEVNLGIMPGWGGTQRLPRMIPWCKAAELMLLGKPIDAQEAYRIGLVNKVVPRDQLMTTAREWAENICRVSPLGVRAAKEAMIKGTGVSLDDGLTLELKLFNHLLNSEDYTEGSTAFLGKKKADFKAK